MSRSERYGDDNFMSFTECCDALLAQPGCTEYPHMDRDKYGTRAFEFRPVLDGPDCIHNDKAPSLHVEVYKDMPNAGKMMEMGTEIKMFGSRNPDERSLQVNLYSIRRYEAVAMLPKARAVMQAIWLAFCAEMEK